jgi:hypothetical protein
MTAAMTGASSAKPDDIWSDLNWPVLELHFGHFRLADAIKMR